MDLICRSQVVGQLTAEVATRLVQAVPGRAAVVGAALCRAGRHDDDDREARRSRQRAQRGRQPSALLRPGRVWQVIYDHQLHSRLCTPDCPSAPVAGHLYLPASLQSVCTNCLSPKPRIAPRCSASAVCGRPTVTASFTPACAPQIAHQQSHSIAQAKPFSGYWFMIAMCDTPIVTSLFHSCLSQTEGTAVTVSHSIYTSTAPRGCLHPLPKAM